MASQDTFPTAFASRVEMPNEDLLEAPLMRKEEV